MQIYNHNSKQQSFKAIYSIQGKPLSLKKFYSELEEELSRDTVKFKIKKIGEDILGIATEFDVKHVQDTSFDSIAKSFVLELKDLLNPKKIVLMNYRDGWWKKALKFKENGIKYICSQTARKNNRDNAINMIHLKKTKPLIDSLEDLVSIPMEKKFDSTTFHNDLTPLWRLFSAIEEIKKCKELSGLRIKGLLGKGAFSTAFEMPDNKCLKLSFTPNAPLVDATFDPKTYMKGKISLKNYVQTGFGFLRGESNNLYYAVTDKVVNNNELRIGNHYLKEVKDEIYKSNYQNINIFDFDERQVGLFKGKALLVDAPIVEDRPLFV